MHPCRYCHRRTRDMNESSPVHGEGAVRGGETCHCGAVHQALVAGPVLDEVRDGDSHQPVLLRKRQQLRRARHGPVLRAEQRVRVSTRQYLLVRSCWRALVLRTRCGTFEREKLGSRYLYTSVLQTRRVVRARSQSRGVVQPSEDARSGSALCSRWSALGTFVRAANGHSIVSTGECETLQHRLQTAKRAVQYVKRPQELSLLCVATLGLVPGTKPLWARSRHQRTARLITVGISLLATSGVRDKSLTDMSLSYMYDSDYPSKSRVATRANVLVEDPGKPRGVGKERGSYR
eukprot:1189354-Prorocentrum_minimum.AAC.2